MSTLVLDGQEAPVGASASRGLSSEEARRRAAAGQANIATHKPSRTYVQILRENLLTFFNVVLFAISLALLLLGSPRDAFFTAGVALLNVVVASAQEIRAKRKLDQIALLTRPRATVIRDGYRRTVQPEAIVLGDLLLARPGDQILVDGQVVGKGQADLDESLLTGESDPVPKATGDKVYSGSFVVNGQITFRAERVGDDSMAYKLVEGARTFTREVTPLQRNVDLIIRALLVVVVFFGGLITVSFYLNEGGSLLDSLRVAAVVFGLAPSSLFLTIVVAYAMGAVRIVDKGALVQQANSVESLCHVTVLCLDKTGTLTANHLRLECLAPLGPDKLDETELRRMLGRLAHSITTPNRTSRAIAAACQGRKETPLAEVPFSSARRWSALVLEASELDQRQGQQAPYVLVLGAPEALAAHLPDGEDILAEAETWAMEGMRVLVLARGDGSVSLHDEQGRPLMPDDLTPLALVGLADELRPEAGETLEGFRRAGISLKIISGDSPTTVLALARQAGFVSDKPLRAISGSELDLLSPAELRQTVLDTSIFGRITPIQKETLVRMLRESGQYVAMTGDGVNDVLALKQAKLGIAMQSGSQATRSVADIILLNDSFAALPQAFREGQRILNGMNDVLKLYMTRILSLAMLIGMVAMLSVGFPLTPPQSAVISMLTLALPAFALAYWARPGAARQADTIRSLIHFVVPAGLTMAMAGLGVYLLFIFLTDDWRYAQLALTYAMMGTGLVLIIFVEPPSTYWVGGDDLSGDGRPTLLAIGLFLLFIIGQRVPFLEHFFGLGRLSHGYHYLIVAAVVLAWTLSLRFVWRARLMERYFHLV